MKSITPKRYSLLGIIILMASGVVAFFSPASNNSNPKMNNGVLMLHSGTAGPFPVITCVPNGFYMDCTATTLSLLETTTGRGMIDSYGGIDENIQTYKNTSLTGDQVGNQSSIMMWL